MDERDHIERMFGPPQPGDPDFEPYDPAKHAEALAALAAHRAAVAAGECTAETPCPERAAQGGLSCEHA